MKLTFLMCVLLVSSLSAEVLSQQRLNMRLGKTDLKAVFEEIRKQTDKVVICNDDRLKLDQKVNADFQNIKLEDLLDLLLRERDLSYKMVDDYIVIVPGVKGGAPQAVEEKVVKGKVTDKAGQALPGVTVMIKGTSIGVATDQMGGIYYKGGGCKGFGAGIFVCRHEAGGGEISGGKSCERNAGRGCSADG